MKMTNEQYGKYVKSRVPRSPLGRDMFRAFISGGLICGFGQFLINFYSWYLPEKTDASLAASITLVFLGAMLTGFGLYDDIAKFSGAGTLVPITGFANAVVSPALEFKTEGYVTGTAAKMFIIAGPVIVFGISASVIYGLFLVLLQ